MNCSWSSTTNTNKRLSFPTFSFEPWKKENRKRWLTHCSSSAPWILIYKHQNEMKFITFFAFVVASASATTIFPSTHSNCQPQDLPPISACGETNLAGSNVAGARIDYTGQTVTWFEQANCEGISVSVGASIDCLTFPFTPGCVKIVC